MVYREKLPDGSVVLRGAPPATRIGTTPIWAYADSTDIPATFQDGKPARIGDYVISTNGLSTGEMYIVTAIYPSGNVDVAYFSNFRFTPYDDTGWHIVGNSGEPAFQNGFTHYSPTDNSAWESVAFRRFQGVVYLRGLIRNNTTAKPTSTLLFTLPAGYRPATDKHIDAAMSGAFGLVNVMRDGRVLSNLAVAASAWITLAIPPFIAEQ